MRPRFSIEETSRFFGCLRDMRQAGVHHVEIDVRQGRGLEGRRSGDFGVEACVGVLQDWLSKLSHMNQGSILNDTIRQGMPLMFWSDGALDIPVGYAYGAMRQQISAAHLVPFLKLVPEEPQNFERAGHILYEVLRDQPFSEALTASKISGLLSSMPASVRVREMQGIIPEISRALSPEHPSDIYGCLVDRLGITLSTTATLVRVSSLQDQDLPAQNFAFDGRLAISGRERLRSDRMSRHMGDELAFHTDHFPHGFVDAQCPDMTGWCRIEEIRTVMWRDAEFHYEAFRSGMKAATFSDIFSARGQRQLPPAPISLVSEGRVAA